MNREKALTCQKCSARMFVDRVFLSHDHLEIYCMTCGRREMYHNPQKHGERIRWIMEVEKKRAKAIGNKI